MHLDLTQLDAVSPNLYLLVSPANELDVAVRLVSHHIARPVEPSSRFRAVRMRNETFRRQLRSIPVSLSQTGSSDA